MNKFKQYMYDLFWSNFKTKNLFKFAIYSCITPLVIFILIMAALIVPSIIAYNNIEVSDITNNVSYLDKVLAYTLGNEDIKCSIGDAKLSCQEDYSYQNIYEFKNNNDDTIKYSIFINQDISNVDLSTGKFGQHYDTDNYLIFFETTFVYRYTYHDPRTESVNEYQLYGFYDNLDSIDFNSIYTEANSMEDNEQYLLEKSHFIILEGYKAVAYESIFTNIVINAAVYLLFMLIVALLIKGNYLLKRKKGFKYTQALKIGFVSSLQSAFIGALLSLFGLDFFSVFGLAIVVRILYIYIRYTGSKKNTTWLDDLYELTKDERFNP